MHVKLHKALGLLSLLLIVSMLFSACSLFETKKKGPEGVKVPKISEESPEKEAKKNERGLSDREQEYLNYGEDKLTRLIQAFNHFGDETVKYQDDAINKGIILSENKDFIDSRDQLFEACSNVELVPLSSVPASLSSFFEQNFKMANHCRQMLYQIERQNATNLPDAYNTVLTEINEYALKAQNFINTVQSQGIDAAQGLIEPLNWEDEMAKSPELTSHWDVASLGLPFGSTRAEVMGVEGLIKGYDKLDKLEYNTEVYTYKGVRKYFFNEYDQLYKYVYVLRPNYQNPYLDLNDLFLPVNHGFQVEEYFMQNFVNHVQGPNANDEYSFTIDRPHLVVVCTATANHPEIPIQMEVTAKIQDDE